MYITFIYKTIYSYYIYVCVYNHSDDNILDKNVKV